jgi:RNA polymerase sigma-70 factor (sigma-E family)
MITNVGTAPRAAKGQKLEELYIRHAPAAIRLAFVLTGSREAAEDLAHDAFVRLAGRFTHVRRAESFGAYLRKTVVNLHLSRLRRLRLERAHIDRLRSGDEHAATMPDVPERVDVWQALQSLPPRQRAALALRYYEDLSERETAEMLGCSLAAVKSLVARGTTALSRQMRGGEG